MKWEEEYLLIQNTYVNMFNAVISNFPLASLLPEI